MRTSLFLIFVVLALATSNSTGQLPLSRRIAIPEHELNTRYEVMGPLGAPLGSVITIVGKRIQIINKGDSDQIRVLSIAGRPLQRPVDMPFEIASFSNVKDLASNTPLELRVYQDGGFKGVPQQAMQETVVIQTWNYHFATHLVVINQLWTQGAPR